MTIPNVITIARLLLVPAIVLFILEGSFAAAFVLFVVAGISDAIDGAIAKRFDQASTLGSYLDPLADKALLVAAFITLGIGAHLPAWLVILVVSRDVLIIGAVILATLIGIELDIRPVLSSKANTLCQIILTGLTLAELAFAVSLGMLPAVMIYIVAAMTVISGTQYLIIWFRAATEGTEA